MEATVNKQDLSWILHTSVYDAEHRIKTTNLVTLQTALEQEKASKCPRKSLISAIERRIRVLSRTESKVKQNG